MSCLSEQKMAVLLMENLSHPFVKTSKKLCAYSLKASDFDSIPVSIRVLLFEREGKIHRNILQSCGDIISSLPLDSGVGPRECLMVTSLDNQTEIDNYLRFLFCKLKLIGYKFA